MSLLSARNVRFSRSGRPVLDGVIKRLHLTRERNSVQLIQLIPLVRPLMDLLGVHIAPRPLTYEEFTNKSVVHMFFPRPYVPVDLVEDSDLLEYEAWGDSVEQAVAIANASAHAFADRENELRREECVRLQESVDARLPKVRGDYERALADLRDFREKAFSVNMETEAEQFATILYALYAARETNAVDLARRRAEIAAAKTQLDGLPQFRKSSEVIQRNDFAESIKASLRDLSLDLANTRTRFKPDHPAVKDIENKIEEAKKLLKEQAKKVFGSESLNFNPVYQAAEERLLTAYVEEAAYASMDAAYAQVITAREKDIANFAPKQETVALLEARLEAARALYVVFLTLQSQTGGGKDMDFSIVRFVEPAVIPGKLSDHMRPKISLSLAVTVFLAFFLALTAALTAEYLDDAVRSRQDLAACLPPGFTLPVLCLPEAAPDDPRIVQAFRSLRLALARQGRPPALICLTSPAPGQGRARAACGLAASLAALTEDPDAVLVVNADADAPGAFDALFPAPAPDRPGLTDVLAGAADFESAAVGGTVPGTRYLGYGQGAAPAHLLSPADSPAMPAAPRGPQVPCLIYGVSRPTADLLLQEISLRTRSLGDLVTDMNAQLERVSRMPAGWPLARGAGRITSTFGYRIDPFTRRVNRHSAMDISARHGTSIVATASGKVVEARYDGDYGNKVVIDHGGGMATLYAHLSKMDVKPGQTVKRGEVIGRVGSTGRSTGAHLHYEVHVKGTPVNPARYLSK
mgnify:CR=1 FL=1